VTEEQQQAIDQQIEYERAVRMKAADAIGEAFAWAYAVWNMSPIELAEAGPQYNRYKQPKRCTRKGGAIGCSAFWLGM